eukprot:TRINITY_DN9849_c0_g1_i1.p1 TRINITY_DN9849_c0_g1~~TRINITY_DN9849_c0_g1_i1.p1  ORF type:complete len:592 (-),score=107.89 TRINITY_DN9849_c0_g1_i1:9-1784(-)
MAATAPVGSAPGAVCGVAAATATELVARFDLPLAAEALAIEVSRTFCEGLLRLGARWTSEVLAREALQQQQFLQQQQRGTDDADLGAGDSQFSRALASRCCGDEVLDDTIQVGRAVEVERDPTDDSSSDTVIVRMCSKPSMGLSSGSNTSRSMLSSRGSDVSRCNDKDASTAPTGSAGAVAPGGCQTAPPTSSPEPQSSPRSGSSIRDGGRTKNGSEAGAGDSSCLSETLDYAFGRRSVGSARGTLSLCSSSRSRSSNASRVRASQSREASQRRLSIASRSSAGASRRCSDVACPCADSSAGACEGSRCQAQAEVSPRGSTEVTPSFQTAASELATFESPRSRRPSCHSQVPHPIAALRASQDSPSTSSSSSAATAGAAGAGEVPSRANGGAAAAAGADREDVGRQCVEILGRRYAVLPFASPGDREVRTDMYGKALEVPPGWEVLTVTAEDFPQVVSQLASFGWGTCLLCVSNAASPGSSVGELVGSGDVAGGRRATSPSAAAPSPRAVATGASVAASFGAFSSYRTALYADRSGPGELLSRRSSVLSLDADGRYRFRDGMVLSGRLVIRERARREDAEALRAPAGRSDG